MTHSLGEVLKGLRKDAELSLHSLQNQTKIPYRYLRSLEKEKFDDLPEPVFVKGFLKQWAEVTGGDVQELYALYDAQTAKDRKSAVRKAHPLRFSRPRIWMHFSVKRLLLLGVLCLCIGLPVYFYGFHSSSSVPRLYIDAPLEVSSVSVDGVVHIAGSSENVARLMVNDMDIPLQEDGTFSYVYSLKKGSNRLLLLATSENGKQVEVIRNVVYGEVS